MEILESTFTEESKQKNAKAEMFFSGVAEDQNRD